MTYKEMCKEALRLGLAKTSTEFWKAQRASGMNPEEYLKSIQRVENSYTVEEKDLPKDWETRAIQKGFKIRRYVNWGYEITEEDQYKGTPSFVEVHKKERVVVALYL